MDKQYKSFPKSTKLFIGGKWVESVSKKQFSIYNPSTEELIAKVSEGDKEDIDLAVKAAEKAFHKDSPWRKMTPQDRKKILLKIADLIKKEAKDLALLESLNNGSPLPLQESIISGLPENWEYNASFIGKMDGRVVEKENTQCVISYEPIGVCGVIIPWNVPLWCATVKLAPCLAMGNTVVVKPSEKTPLTILRLVEIFQEAGLPDGVVNVVNGYGHTCGSALSKHMKVRKIAFTGSTFTGRKILVEAANSNLKKVQLELGGKSPVIISKNCNLDKAAQISLIAIFTNNGQFCTAGSKTYVHEDNYDEFVKKITALASKMKVGDQFSSDMGPIVDKIQFDKVMGYIESGKKEAKLLHGGKRVGNKGYLIEPTIFGDVKEDHLISREEIFGPCMSIIKYKDIEDVVDKCNESEYGLAASIISDNVKEMFHISKSLRAGTVWVNTYHEVYPDVEFGGFRQSGYGRDCGKTCIEDWTIPKTTMFSKL